MTDVERMDPDRASLLSWSPVVRFFVGGPLDGRAIEGADSREYEAGPMAATSDYWHDGWLLYTPRRDRRDDPHGWLVYVLHSAETLRRARSRYVAGELDLAELEQAVGWALAVERL